MTAGCRTCPGSRGQSAGAQRAPQRPAVARSEPQVAELELGGLRWLNIETPTAVETAYLAEHFDFHELDLEDVLSTRQRPKIDEYDDYLFIVLHLPRFDKVDRAG